MKTNLFELTTLRNRDLITTSEQIKMRDTTVAFFGLSVGSHAALTWAMQSRANKIIIADPDTIEASNLNRIRASVDKIGDFKVHLVRDEIKGINPKVKIVSLINTEIKDIEQLFQREREINFIVEEIDNIRVKIFLRHLAKIRKIPLINATDVGNNVFVDVERYDLIPQPAPFLGKVKEINNIDFDKLTLKDLMRLSVRIVGLENNSYRMLDSLLKIGKTIKTWPQIGATATMSGGIITTVITKIILGERVKSGRYIVSLDKIFETEDDKTSLNRTKRLIKQMLDI